MAARRARSAAALRTFLRSKAAIGGLVFVVMLLLVAVGADIISPPERGELGPAVTSPPTLDHLMGTDDLGRDLLHRFVHGARISLSIGAFAALMSALVGVLVGLLSGYHGGTMDNLLMRLTEAIQVMPRFFLALVVAVLFGSSVVNVILIIGLLSWPSIARLVRVETLAMREREFVQAARAIGVPTMRIIFREIMPNAVAPAVVAATLLVSQAILTESALAYLGLGDQSFPSWGSMLNHAQPYFRIAWWMSFFPGLGIVVASLAFNLLGDGLNDALNPKLRPR